MERCTFLMSTGLDVRTYANSSRGVQAPRWNEMWTRAGPPVSVSSLLEICDLFKQRGIRENEFGVTDLQRLEAQAKMVRGFGSLQCVCFQNLIKCIFGYFDTENIFFR